MSSYPTAPALPNDDSAKYEALIGKKQQDAAPVDRKANAPKWYERLLGGAVGFGVGYKEGPTAGIRAGSQITTRRYDTAVDDQRAKLQQDQADLDAWQKEHDLGSQRYEQGLQGFGASMQVANAQRGQANSDRAYQRDVQNDQRTQSNSDRAFQFEQGVHTDELKQRDSQNDLENRRFTETVRHNRADENKRTGEIPSAEATEFQTYVKGLGHPPTSQDVINFKRNAPGSNSLAAGVDENKILTARQQAYDKLEKGDPAKAIDGFQARFTALQKLEVNPTTGKAYTPDERKQALDQLTAENDEAKNQIEAEYSQQMGNLGKPVEPIRYDGRGNPIQQQGQQAAPAPPQQQPAAAPARPAPQQQQPQQGKPGTGKRVSLAQAMSLPQYKGKSKAEVQQAAQALGYTVIP